MMLSSFSPVRMLQAVGWLGAIALSLLTGCTSTPNAANSIDLKLYQTWQLQPGDSLNGYAVVAGLGDISIDVGGKPLYAPFNGRAQQDQRQCVIFSSPDVPAYLFRLCGLSNPQFGVMNQGDRLGTANLVHIATLRKQPNGTWAIVEPSKPIIQRILAQATAG
jgi:hypothetical protein